jgi:hypothetical protein
LAGAALILTGCSITGTWRTVPAGLDDRGFPIVSMTLDEHDSFTATSRHDGHQQTSTGQYRWNGMRLILSPANGREQIFRGRKRLDGTLLLTHTAENRNTRAILERTGE